MHDAEEQIRILMILYYIVSYYFRSGKKVNRFLHRFFASFITILLVVELFNKELKCPSQEVVDSVTTMHASFFDFFSKLEKDRTKKADFLVDLYIYLACI